MDKGPVVSRAAELHHVPRVRDELIGGRSCSFEF